MEIVLYAKEDCDICDAAKEKLKLMDLPFEIRNFDEIGLAVPGWRTNGAVEALAYATNNGGKAPILLINGVPHNYSSAMREAKRLKREAASGS
jgi:hypothetical protein